jgi:hypothetical protein
MRRSGRRVLAMDRLDIAVGVRRAAERYYPTTKHLKHRCLPVNFALLLCMRGLGFPARLVWGFYRRPTNAHAWVESGGIIYDVTATQFQQSAPPVVVTDSEDPNYRAVEGFDEPEQATRRIDPIMVGHGFDIAMQFRFAMAQTRAETGHSGG